MATGQNEVDVQECLSFCAPLFVALHEHQAKSAFTFPFALPFNFAIFSSIVSAIRLIAIQRQRLRVLQEGVTLLQQLLLLFAEKKEFYL